MTHIKAALIAGALVLASGAAMAGPMGGTEGGATAGASPAIVHAQRSAGAASRGYRHHGYEAQAYAPGDRSYAPPTSGWQRAREMGSAIVSGGGVSLR